MPRVEDGLRYQTYSLSQHGDKLWTRENAKPIRRTVEAKLETLSAGRLLVVDASGVEVFDYSFASELFGKLVLRMVSDFPDRYIAVSGLTDYVRENLDAALDSSGVILLELKEGDWDLLGKVSATDRQTFAALKKASKPVGAPELAGTLGIGVTACNERLRKLAQFALVRRSEASSGRLEYLYSAII